VKREPWGYVTVRELAKAAGVTEGRIRQVIGDGLLDAVKVAGAWHIKDVSAVTWLHTRRRPGRPPKSKNADQLKLDLEED